MRSIKESSPSIGQGAEEREGGVSGRQAQTSEKNVEVQGTLQKLDQPS